MNSQINNIVNTFSKPQNHTELLLKLFHQNRLPENVSKREFTMCNNCLMPWALGKFELAIKPSSSKRITRRNHRIERLQSQIKSKQLSQSNSKKLSKKVKRLQQQNNHVAIYKCFCTKTAKTKVQLKKQRKDKVIKADKAKCEIIETPKQENESKPKKVKLKKKKKTAGLIIPPKVNVVMAQSQSSNAKLSKISQMLKQQKDSQSKRPNLDQFFK